MPRSSVSKLFPKDPYFMKLNNPRRGIEKQPTNQTTKIESP